jgi:hypothetical protein
MAGLDPLLSGPFFLRNIMASFRNLITLMRPLAEEALKPLANFCSAVMAGLDPHTR